MYQPLSARHKLAPRPPPPHSRADFTGNFYDLKPLCTGATAYTSPQAASGWTVSFQVCGTANTKCNPLGYTPSYNWGSAVQFIDNNAPAQNCTDNSGVTSPCTPNCEVIGIGIPKITWMDPNNPGQGVNLSYYSVPDQSKDGAFECPTDPVVRRQARGGWWWGRGGGGVAARAASAGGVQPRLLAGHTARPDCAPRVPDGRRAGDEHHPRRLRGHV